MLGADQQNKKELEKALQKATKAAEAAIKAAAKSHAQAGLQFEPPAGFQIDLSGVQKVRSFKCILCLISPVQPQSVLCLPLLPRSGLKFVAIALLEESGSYC